MRTRFAYLLACCVAALLGAGCTASSGKVTTSHSAAPSTSATPTSASPSSVAVPDVKTQALSLSDLPSGWSVDTSTDSGGGSEPACFKSADSWKSVATASADVSYQGGSDGIPLLEESLGTFPAGKAQQSMSEARKVLDGCGKISFTSGGTKLSGALAKMSFPPMGDESAAYQLNLSTGGAASITVGFDVLIARVGDEAFALMYADLGTPDVDQFQQLARKAAAKIGGAPASDAAASSPASASSSAASAVASSTAPATAQFGAEHGVTYKGLTVSVLSASPYSPSQYAAGWKQGQGAVKVVVRLTNTGSAAFDPTLVNVSAHAGPNGDQGSDIYDENVGGGFAGDIPPGQSATAAFAFAVPAADLPGQLTVLVSPGFDYQDAPFTGTVS